MRPVNWNLRGEANVNPNDECVKKNNYHSALDQVCFAIRYVQLDTNEMLCLVAQDALGNVLGTWPQPERNLADLDREM